jgi:hypothetical protein
MIFGLAVIAVIICQNVANLPQTAKIVAILPQTSKIVAILPHTYESHFPLLLPVYCKELSGYEMESPFSTNQKVKD